MVEILTYIHTHIAEKLSAAEVAARFGYSKWYFSARFHAYTGKTFVEYVRHTRISLAAMEVLAGKKITDTAMDYGYDTVSGFQKAFLAEFGCLPKEYKKRVRESRLYYERRKHSMYPLSDRCSALREEAVFEKKNMRYFALQWQVYKTLAMARHGELNNMELTGEWIAEVTEKFHPFIGPGEMLAGFNFGDARYGEGYVPEDDAESRELLRDNGISEEDIEAYFALRGSVDELWKKGPQVERTREEREAQEEWAAIGRCIDSNHTVLGYEKVLKLGFEGLLAEVEKYAAKNGENSLYRAARRICKAAVTMGEKYAAHAKALLEKNDPAYDRADLEKMAASCSRVPRYPAETFLEACQSLVFAHILNTWEDTINANSLGHLDQILYPYYKKDLEEGRITKEEAFETVCCLWLKFYRDYDVQQSCLGGRTPEGKSLVNDLSWLMLDATEQLDFVRCLSVRFDETTDPAFLRRALEVVGHVQKGVPFFFNDDVMVPALVEKGIAPEDAWNYTQIGCVETVIPGKSNPHAVTGETNLLKALEYVLCDGHSMMYPDFCPGAKTGELENFKTYEALYAAVKVQIRRILEITCGMVKKSRDISVFTAPKPYKSLLTEGCIESGRDFNDAGAIYDYYQIMLGGVPNLADSLAVIRKFIYEDKTYTLSRLKEILEADFPEESVRLDFVNKAPKFGNDLEEVDSIAADIVDFACDVLEEQEKVHGLSFHAQPFTFLWMVDHGNHSAASPDGRRKGEIIAYSVSPMQGRDFNGLTALLNSISCFPTKRTAGTTSAIVEVDPKLYADHNLDMLTDMLFAAGKKGLSNVQFNTVDVDTLLKARADPQRYSNLAVRVSGFSQKFNLLSPELQDHIINRTKHACL